MARRSAGTGARTPTASPPGARPAGPCRSGPAPARPPWRPSAARATTTDAGSVGLDVAPPPGGSAVATHAPRPIDGSVCASKAVFGLTDLWTRVGCYPGRVSGMSGHGARRTALANAQLGDGHRRAAQHFRVAYVAFPPQSRVRRSKSTECPGGAALLAAERRIRCGRRTRRGQWSPEFPRPVRGGSDFDGSDRLSVTWADCGAIEPASRLWG